ncbi:Gfo/Idh/MocA family oxidoreductase [Mycobacterium sp. 141]|uniref:Gfo/Idh/MocA family oxidoreductase n=1 Tax=Mycobacterium sp. 141 TaxID=1120797 RepID=UPI00037FDDA4|nr:Gfo/Idh/MocA family oxidoreductase [Mycobacterium sp. 141]
MVVGATFGAVYAEALSLPDSPVDLVALVSTGSSASADLARSVGVPLYTNIDDLDDVDIAFVVVRSGVVGGQGVQISEELLSRGIHVLQEQPVHADEILALLRTARANSVLYAVNDFYSHVESVRQFVSAARSLAARSPIDYVHARCSLQVIFPLFTVLASFVGPLSPARVVVADHSGGPFASGRIYLGPVQVDILVQNELCASDPDGYARLMHTVAVGTSAGELVLEHTHGSTWWYPRLHPADDEVDRPLTELVGVGFAPTRGVVRNELWPSAVRRAATEFVAATKTTRSPLSQRFIRATRLWSEFTSAIGPVNLIDPQPLMTIRASELARLDC